MVWEVAFVCSVVIVVILVFEEERRRTRYQLGITQYDKDMAFSLFVEWSVIQTMT